MALNAAFAEPQRVVGAPGSLAVPPSVWNLGDDPRPELWGRNSVSPFTLGDGRSTIELDCGGATGIMRFGRLAVMATEPLAPPGEEDTALDELLEVLKGRGLRPVFAAVVDEDRFRRRGLHTRPIAEDAIIDLDGFSFAGKRRASIRHSVASAHRGGLRVVPWSPRHAEGAEAVSAQWLSTKRGGEMGFTLGRFDPAAMDSLDCRLAVDDDDRVVGLVTWHRYDAGRSTVLDLMRRLPDAPNPTMDLLVAESLLEFSRAGVERASLGSVPLSGGELAERVYPTRSLWRYKSKFAPTWETRHLVVPTRRSLPFALRAMARCYCPAGLSNAIRRNA